MMNKKGKGMKGQSGIQRMMILIVGLMCFSLVATGGLFRKTEPKDNGLTSLHTQHARENMECSTCHIWEEGIHIAPTHDMCSICHDIDEESEDKASCMFCHTRKDFSVDVFSFKRLKSELQLDHAPHEAAGVSCAECHSSNDEIPELPKGSLKPLCMECHAALSPELESLREAGAPPVSTNECSICHTEISAEKRPLFRGDARIPHDVPEVWMKVHGFEAQFDPAYCSVCHDRPEVSSCDECHQKMKPQDHTVAWRRKPHGLKAMMDRNTCAVCHEEEQCSKCHNNTKPASHRGAFDGPLNQHCISCHDSPQDSSCAVCHENIEHHTARLSPHDFGIYPPNCARCHPGGLPHRAPHLLNNTVGCRDCHQ